MVGDDRERFTVQVVPKMSHCPHESGSLSLVAQIIALCLVVSSGGIRYNVLMFVVVPLAQTSPSSVLAQSVWILNGRSKLGVLRMGDPVSALFRLSNACCRVVVYTYGVLALVSSFSGFAKLLKLCTNHR